MTSNDAVRSVLVDTRFNRCVTVPRFVGRDHTSVLGSMFNADDEDHARLRRVITPAFTLSRFADFEVEMRAKCIDLIAAAKDKVRVDLIDEYCAPCSRWFTRRFLDVPEALQAEIETVVRAQTDLAGDAEAVEKATERMAELSESVLMGIDEAGQATPLARLRRAVREGTISRGEALGTTSLLLMVTTDALLPPLSVGAMKMLLDDGLQARCSKDRSLWPHVAAEVFRYSNNALVEFPRVATGDVRLQGVRIRDKEAVVTSTLAAGWDSAAVDKPAAFTIDRSSDRSFPFGLGRRACPARGVAQAALTLALEVLFTEIRRPRLVSDPGQSIPPGSICPSRIWVRP